MLGRQANCYSQDNALQTKIYLGTFAVLNANTDGGIILRKQNAHGSNVLGNYPIVSFEVRISLPPFKSGFEFLLLA